MPVIVSTSHPSRVRELKRFDGTESTDQFMSHPSRVRELKQVISRQVMLKVASHPSRVRELKLLNKLLQLLYPPVAPLPGA